MKRQGYRTHGVTIISILSPLKILPFALCSFFFQEATIKFSELITKKMYTEPGKLYVDLMRLALIFGLATGLAAPHLLIIFYFRYAP